MIVFLLASALAAEAPSCSEVVHDDAPDALSVAWVSRAGKRVRRRGQMAVVSTAELKGWTSTDGGASVGRMLQRMGLRKKSKAPPRRWKVVVFDARRGDLCRPIGPHPEPIAVAGVLTCSEKHSKPDRSQTGCGNSVDRANGDAAFELFRGSWTDLARDGFCVLPAERFVGKTETPAASQ